MFLMSVEAGYQFDFSVYEHLENWIEWVGKEGVNNAIIYCSRISKNIEAPII